MEGNVDPSCWTTIDPMKTENIDEEDKESSSSEEELNEIEWMLINHEDVEDLLSVRSLPESLDS